MPLTNRALIVRSVPEEFTRKGTGFNILMPTDSIVVMGRMKEAGELPAALNKFRTYNKEVSDAVLNLMEGRDENDPREIEERHYWPTMVYRADNKYKAVGNRNWSKEQNEAALKEAFADGYRKEPYVVPQVAVADPQIEKRAIMDQNAELRTTITKMADAQQKLLDRLTALEKGDDAPKSKKPFGN